MTIHRCLLPVVRCLVAGATWVLVCAAGPRAAAQDEPQPAGGYSDLYRRAKTFDFDERPLGNYEDTPMFWQRLEGPGLPRFSDARFDDAVGHAAAPSFRFDLAGENIGYEYAHPDLTISPESDYLIEGYVRTAGLEHAAAVLVCYLADQTGAAIPGSEHVTQPVRSPPDAEADGASDWQPVEILLRGEYPAAHTLRLQLWVLQDYVVQDRDGAVDPIIHHEVDAQVWFDDISVIRMPRVRLTFSNPGSIVAPGARESFLVDIHNATLAPLHAALTVTDAAGTEHLQAGSDIAPRTTDKFDVDLPPLVPGMYTARLELLSADALLTERVLRIAVLPPLFARNLRYPDHGIDLGVWPRSDPTGAVELITRLGCGAVKVGLPMLRASAYEEEAEYAWQIRALARQLALHQIETTGVLLAPEFASGVAGGRSTYRMITREPNWDDFIGPVFALLGGHLTSWQLGTEPCELAAPDGWTAEAIRNVRTKLERFVAIPHLVVPRSVLDAAATAVLPGTAAPEGSTGLTWDAGADEQPYAFSFWIPETIPARAMPWQLAFWFEASAAGANRWLSLGLEDDPRCAPATRLADMARRVVIASAINPERLYVPAPFEHTVGGGVSTWQPTDAYIPLRTLVHHLSGRRAIASMTLDPDAVCVLFGDERDYVLVAWTWEQRATPRTVDLYVGREARLVTLAGETLPLATHNDRAQVPLSEMPIILTNVDAPLVLLQRSFAISPAFIQLHNPEPRPVLMLQNHYPTELIGRIELTPPPTWDVTPTPIRLELAPGETARETLQFTVPPRHIASEQTLGVDLHVTQPRLIDVHFDVVLEIGLKEIVVTGSAWWEGNDLIVEQTLHNFSPRIVSFNGFCQALHRPRREGVFLDMPPGESVVRQYRFPAARDLAGSQVWIGISEIGGRRTLDQLVAVPN
jgi:hypothetical protein